MRVNGTERKADELAGPDMLARLDNPSSMLATTSQPRPVHKAPNIIEEAALEKTSQLNRPIQRPLMIDAYSGIVPMAKAARVKIHVLPSCHDVAGRAHEGSLAAMIMPQHRDKSQEVHNVAR